MGWSYPVRVGSGEAVPRVTVNEDVSGGVGACAQGEQLVAGASGEQPAIAAHVQVAISADAVLGEFGGCASFAVPRFDGVSPPQLGHVEKRRARVHLANGTSLCQAAGDREETESLVMVR